MSQRHVPIVAVALSMASLAWLLAVTFPVPDSPIGEGVAVRAAEFSLPDLRGAEVSSDSLRGKVVIVDVWATWCGPCLGEIPAYNALYEEMSARGVELLAVTVQSGDADQVRAVVESDRFRINYPVAMATRSFEETFGPLWALPTTFVIDQDWRVRQRWVGMVPDKHEQIRAVVDELLTTR